MFLIILLYFKNVNIFKFVLFSLKFFISLKTNSASRKQNDFVEKQSVFVKLIEIDTEPQYSIFV